VKNPLDSTFENRDPYGILGVATGAAPADIRKAYLRLARRHHPNLFATDPEKYRAATALMQEINAAYELLSDPGRRGLWDRQHSIAPHLGRVARRERELKKYFDSELVARVIRKYNGFVSSLRTAAERKKATQQIRKFQTSRAGTAYITGLASLHYREVMDFLRQDKRVSFFDDGLVEIMLLYERAFEVYPSSVFITYAWLCHQENGGKFPPELDVRPSPSQQQSVVRLRLPGPRGDPAPAESNSVRRFGSQVWDWLMARPGERRS
jgi:curved DNA-binding protein CbpA